MFPAHDHVRAPHVMPMQQKIAALQFKLKQCRLPFLLPHQPHRLAVRKRPLDMRHGEPQVVRHRAKQKNHSRFARGRAPPASPRPSPQTMTAVRLITWPAFFQPACRQRVPVAAKLPVQACPVHRGHLHKFRYARRPSQLRRAVFDRLQYLFFGHEFFHGFSPIKKPPDFGRLLISIFLILVDRRPGPI